MDEVRRADDPLPLEGRDRGWRYEDSFLVRFAAKESSSDAIAGSLRPCVLRSRDA
jgi:hypothetical protein